MGLSVLLNAREEREKVSYRSTNGMEVSHYVIKNISFYVYTEKFFIHILGGNTSQWWLPWSKNV